MLSHILSFESEDKNFESNITDFGTKSRFFSFSLSLRSSLGDLYLSLNTHAVLVAVRHFSSSGCGGFKVQWLEEIFSSDSEKMLLNSELVSQFLSVS